MNKRKLLAVAVMVLTLLFTIPFMASAEEPTKNGWYRDKGYYEYFENGTQYTNGEYWIDGNCFRFDENGKMYSAQWYRNPETLDYYYYQAGGYRADNCVIKIDGSYYGFGYNGVMYSNTEFHIYFEEYDEWSYYYANSGGALKTNQWVWFADTNYEKGGYWKYYGATGATYSGIAKVGNSYYYFNYDGSMFDGETASIYIESLDDYVYIRAKAGGALYCGEWYKDEYGDWYYYTKDAVGAQGYTLVGSTYYVFYDDGGMVTDTVYYDDVTGCTYLADKNGVVSKLNANGWTKVDKNWYYCVDGMCYRDEIALIGNSYYYFNWDGIMLDNDAVSVYDYDIEEWKYIRAKAGGALYCGAWYQDYDGNFEYYGYDCYKIQFGFETIGGNQYYFEYGYAAKDEIIETDSAVYLAGSNCVLSIRSTGWINVNNDFYYVYNDQLVRDTIMEISGKYYIFSSYGRMLANEQWYIYFNNNAYLTNQDGSLITEPGWEVRYENWYYINEDFTLAQGYTTIADVTYYFYPEMVYSTFDYLIEEDGETAYLYVVAPDGKYEKITADGYYSTPYGKLLVENGKLFTGWKNIGGKFYYFWPEMCYGGICYLSDGAYYFDATGVMQVGWIPYRDTYLYADAYGRLADGVKAVGGKYYLFKDYKLAYDSYSNTSEGIYVSDANAIATLLPSGDGWKNANGYFYYVENENLVTGYHYMYENNNDEEVCYLFDFDTGRMKADEYHSDYYFDAYGRRYEGWKQIDGAWSYFGPYKYSDDMYWIDDEMYCFDNGKMVANTTYYSWSDDMMFVIDAYGKVVDSYEVPDGIIYKNGNAYLYQDGEAYNGWYGENYFDYGEMVIDKVIRDKGNRYYIDTHGKYVRNGWHHVTTDGSDYWIYANAYGELCEDEWLHLGNAWYYFQSYRMLSNGIRYIEAEDKYAEFDEYGKFIKYVDSDSLPTSKANTWKFEDGKWHYYNSTGAMVYGGTLYIGNAWYAFDYNENMVTNDFFHDYYYDSFYYYTASGARLNASNEWKIINGKWCYFDANGSASYYWTTIGSNRYYIDVDYSYDDATGTEHYELEMYTGYHLIDGKVYYFDAYGACKGEYVGNGWLRLADGDYVYFKDGKLLTDGTYTIGTAKYLFLENGLLLTGDYGYDGDKYVFASESGALYSTGWHNTSKGWIYIDASGEAATYGVYNINGGIYFFDSGYWIP